MKIRTTVIHPTEWRRTIKAFFNFSKYLFNKDNKKFQKKFNEKIKNIEKTNYTSTNKSSVVLPKESVKAEVKV